MKIQKTQGKLFKAAVAMGTVADLLLSAETKGANTFLDSSTCIKMALDAVTLLGSASQDLSMQRREAIRPDLNSQFRQLCSPQCPVTNMLFGDDLPKTIKGISETHRVAMKLAAGN